MKLKHYIGGILSVLVLVMGLSTAAVWAVDNPPGQASDKPALSEADKKKLQERLNQRKAEYKVTLTAAQKTRLQSRCKAAQGHLTSLKARVKGQETGRREVYNKIITRLNELSVKLKERNLDTTALDAAIATLQGKVTTFNTNLAAYEQAVSDLAEMDCAADPDAFKASLDAARAALEKVGTGAKDIRSYVKDEIKPVLADIRSQLAGEQPSGSQ